MKTRILAFFLTLCMILSMVPAVAFAEEAPAPSMDAIKFNSSFEEDATIKLDQDLTVALTTAVTGKVTIDLNGFELDGTIVGTEGLTIEVKDSSKTHGTINVAVTNATVLMTQGKIGAATLASKYEINTESDVAANDVTYYGKVWAIGEVGYANLTKALAADVAANTTITYCGTAALTENIVPNKDVIVDVKGAAITFGTLGAEGKSLTIKNAKYTNGVVFAGNVTLDGCSTAGTTAFSTTGAGKLTVANGTHAWLTQELVNDVANKVSVPTNAVVINNTVVVPEAGNTGSIVAVIGAKGYDSLSKAITAWMNLGAGDRTSIDLIANIEGYIEVTGTAPVVLNLNGKNINATFINNGELIVKGEGSITAITNKGTLTLKSGTINSLTNLKTFVMDGGTLDSFGAGSDLKGVTVNAGLVANGIYSSEIISAGSVGFAKDQGGNTSETHMLVKAAPVVLEREGKAVAGYITIEAAYEKAKAGDTIKLNQDFDLVALTIEKAITIDLNGKTLTVTSASLEVKSDVTIKNGSVVATTVTPLVIKGGTVVVDAIITSVERAAVNVWNGNLVVEKNAEITSTGLTAITSNELASDNPVEDPAVTVSINGGKVTGKYYAVYMGGGDLTINGGTLKGDKNAVYAAWVTAVVINGGTFTSVEDVIKAVYWFGKDGETEIVEIPTIAINGGEFTVPAGKKLLAVVKDNSSDRELNEKEAATFKSFITGGTFNGVTTANYAEFVEYLADSVAPKADFEFGKALVVDPAAEYVIAVNGVKYSSWAAAYAAGVAAGSAKPTFVAIDTTPNTIVVYGDIVLDLNGQTLDGLTLEIVKDEDGTYTCNPVVEVLSNKAGAKITNTINVLYGRIKVNANTRLTIAVEDAPVINVGKDAISISQIYGNNNDKITVYADEDVYAVAGEGAAKVQIVGGGWNISPTYANVPAGYIITEDEGVYTVSANSEIVAEIVPLLDGTSVERFTSVSEAVDYYIANYTQSGQLTHYIKLIKTVDNQMDFDVTSIENIKYGVQIPVVANVALGKVANNENYVTLSGATINLNGVVTIQLYSFAKTVAQVDDTFYATVEAAIAAAADGKTVRIISDEPVSFEINCDADKDITINFNATVGHTVVVNANNKTGVEFRNGTIASLTVNGGTIDLGGVTVTTLTANAGSITVKDNAKVVTFNYPTDSTATILLVRCTIDTLNVAGVATTDKQDGWVRSDFTWTVADGKIVIVKTSEIAAMIGNVAYTTVQDALNAAVNGDEIVLYKAETAKLPAYALTITVTPMTDVDILIPSDTYSKDAQGRLWDVTAEEVEDSDSVIYTSKCRVATVDNVNYHDVDSFKAAMKKDSVVVLFDITAVDSSELTFADVNLYLAKATNVATEGEKAVAKKITVNAGCTISTMLNGEYAPEVQLLFAATEGITLKADPEDVDWNFAENVELDRTEVYFKKVDTTWVLAEAAVTGYDEEGNGKGYENLYAALCDANVVEIKLLDDITTDFVVALNNITIDLAGYTWTLANVSGGDPADPAITVTNAVTIKNGKIALDDSKGNDNYVLIEVVDGGDLTVEGLTIPKAFGYNMTEGYSASVVVNGSFNAVDSTIAGDILALGKETTTLSRENTTWGKIIGAFTCGDHQDPVDGECSVCGEEAAEIVYDKDEFNVIVDGKYAESANGVYVYVGTDVSFEFIGDLEYNQILNGITLNGAPEALSATFTVAAVTTYTLAADIATKPVVDVTINANQFTLYDAAGDIKADFFNPTTLSLMVGVEYTITFNGSENVYWVNGDNSIVGTAPEFTFVPTEAVEVKAITYGGGKYVIVLNGPAVAGTTVSYNNPVNAFVSMPALPTTIAGKNVSSWLVNGEAVEGDVVEYIKNAADALYVLTPVYSYADPIVVVINGKDTTVTPGKIHTVTADATIVVEEVTKYFTGWVVKDGETVVYETTSLQLVYNFAKAGLVAEAQYSANEADKAVEEPTVTIGVDGTSVFGHYYNPNGTITSLGIIYSTTNTVEDDVLQGNVKNKDNIDDNEKTAMWNFKVTGEKTVYVQAYMTYIDAVTGQLVTVYSEVASFTTTA